MAAEEQLFDPAALIGASPEMVLSLTGPPSEITATRGDKSEWDTVVFYKDGFYVFWVQNTVWQIRFDAHYTGEWKGLKAGTPYPAVDSILGRPTLQPDGSRIYSLTGYSYPIQVRCFFENDSLSDVYIYRSNGL